MASDMEWSEEYAEGNKTANTFLGPKAFVAKAQTTAESIPPDNPKTAFENPDLEK
jgi:hypothetical protein